MGSTSQTFPQERLPGLDRFTVERQLGEGSMGAVYLALDRERDTRVALKTLRRVDAAGIYRFKREFRALADVNHPNLVVLHELFAEGTEWFFTMEYVEGKGFLDYVLGEAPGEHVEAGTRGTRELPSARKRKTTGMAALFPTPLKDYDELRAIVQQIADALMAVHAAGKLHRDLKPDNVLVTSNGRAVVLDFGIAIESSPDAMNKTLEAGVMGTPAYMSPEQAAGADIDEATDWYALGVMLFEAMTGTVPFSGSFLDVLRQKQDVDPPAPSELVSGVPADLDALCAKLLSRDPRARPRGEEVVAAVRGNAGKGRRDSRPSKPSPEDASCVFIGRKAEQRELERALAATDEGSPVVCFVQGAPGMGKSALIEHFVRTVRDQARAVVLPGRCYERETVPFKAWDSVVDALCRYLGKLPLYAAAELMPKDIEALAHIFPVLKRVEIVNRVKRRTKLSSDPREQRRRAFGALKELLSRIALREPLLVCIDDLQWGDVESARLMVDLITGQERPALLLLCGYRAGDVEASPCLRALFAHTRDNRQTDIRHLTVGALSDDEALEFARRLLGPSTATDAFAVARESRGNPYLLGELAHHLRTGSTGHGLPSISLEGALSERLSRLSQGAFGILELIAVAGRPVHEEILAAVAPTDIDLHAALTELRGGKLVRGVGTASARAVEQNHDGIRDAVLARMDTIVVKHWHKRLADALEAHGTSDLQGLTMHLLGAEDYSRAGIYAIRAAVQASHALAFEQAADLYAIAVKHHEDQAWRQELMVQWADALVNARDGTRAAQVYLEAAQQVAGGDAVDLRRKAGVQLLLAGRLDNALDALRDTLHALGVQVTQDPAEALASTQKLCQQLRKRGLAFTARSPEQLPAGSLDRLDHLWSIALALQLGYPMLAQSLIARHLLDALNLGEPRRVLRSLACYFARIDLFASAHDGAKPRTLQLAEQVFRDHPDAYGRAWLAFAQGLSHLSEGLLKPALLQLTQAEEIFRNQCPGSIAEVRGCRHLSAWLATQLDFSAFEEIERWAAEAESRDDSISARRLRAIATLGTLMADDSGKAESRLREALGERDLDPGNPLALLGVMARGQLHLYRDEPDAARALLTTLEHTLTSPLLGLRVWRAHALLLRARLALLASENEAGPSLGLSLQLTEDSLAQLDALNLPLYADHARLLRAAVAHRRAEPQEAVAWLDAILKDNEQAADGPVVLAAARLCKARLCAASERAEAETLSAMADSAMRACGIQNPIAFARLYAPGFESAAHGQTH